MDDDHDDDYEEFDELDEELEGDEVDEGADEEDLLRLLGLAERAWVGDAPWSGIADTDDMWRERNRHWNEFANRIGQFEMPRLDRYFPGINYRIPPPGARFEGGLFIANTAFPGLAIRYTTDGSEPTINSYGYEGPVRLTGVEIVTLRAFNSAGRGSRSVRLTGINSQ
jgi:hexosaminidase